MREQNNSYTLSNENIYFIYLYYSVTLFSNIAHGISLVTMAWVSLTIGNKLSVVGQIFSISLFCNILIAPFVGPVIDQRNRRHLIITGQTISTLAKLIPILVFILHVKLTLSHLYSIAILSSFSAILIAGSMDGMFQAIISMERRRHHSAMVGGMRQAGLIGGSGGAGLIIHYISPEASFLIAAICCILAAVCVYFLPNAKPNKPEEMRHFNIFQKISEGFKLNFLNRAILAFSLIFAINWSASQLSNALLSSFIRDDIGWGSDIYGFVDSGWSIGGMIASFLIAYLVRLKALKYFEFVFVLSLGITMIIFSTLRLPLHLIIVHGLMGAFFSGCKVLCDGRILQICPEYAIGRVRTNIQSMTSLLGIFMYLSPTIFYSSSARLLYKDWGICVIILGGLIWYYMYRTHKNVRE